MKIEIQNLGAIRQAEIDLSKRLTIFCGPNNSGKTYVAFIIYALTKSGLKYFRTSSKNEVIPELINHQKAIYKINSENIWKYRNDELKGLKESLDSIYGISEEVVKNLFNDFDLKIIETKSEFEESISKMDFENELKINNISILIKKKKNVNNIELSLKSKSISKDNIEVLNYFLEAKLYSLIAFYPFNNSNILPVERNSIYTFSKELSIQKQEFLDRAQALGSKTSSRDPFHWLMKSSKRYPLPIRDGLEVAEDLSNYSKNKSDFFDLAEEIENDLLQGKVIITKEGDVQFSSNKAKSKKIPIHLTASIVKTLSSLVFYLKHIASKNELIIIDEPELNLHPNNQVYLTRIFAKLINKGFRLLISTHSDYIIRELNNLIMASSKNEGVREVAEKLGYTNELMLDKNLVSAYLFNYKNDSARNVTIKPIEVNEEGFDVETIDNTIDELNEKSEELFYAVKYKNQLRMSKIERIDYVLNPDFKINSTELREDSASMQIELIKDRCLSIIFQLDKQLGANYRGGIYPFFNSRNSGVCKVCDYIIFAESNNDLYSLIIELKTGDRDTKPQLRAGECFVDFVIATVNRIYNTNYSINKRFVSIREFERKRKTKLRDIEYDENYHHFFEQNKLRIYTFLK